jgi:hypothetical protein
MTASGLEPSIAPQPSMLLHTLVIGKYAVKIVVKHAESRTVIHLEVYPTNQAT